MAPLLGYWTPRGYAQSIRMILAQAGVEWEEKIYERRDAPDFSHDPEWVKDKADGLGMDFPNLPYYIDGEIKLSQSMAICRYLSRKHGLIAESEPATIRQDLAEYQILDLRTALVHLGYHDYCDEAKAKYLKEALPRHLTLMSKFLGDKEWLTGEKLNFVDFLLYDVLDWHLYLEPECLKEYDNLVAFMKRVQGLPKIQTWMSSSKHKSWPLFNKVAKWGYKDSDQYVRYPALAHKA